MEDEIFKKIEAQDRKLDEIYSSVEKIRKYFLITLVITLAAVVIPLIGLMFIIPQFLNTLSGSYLGL